MLGSLTAILNISGQAVILNIFFGPVVNAAKSVSDRINSIMVSFSNNFYTAVRPQLIKKYSGGDIDGMLSLAYRSTKYAFFIQLLVSLPLLLLTKELLELWLGSKNVTTEMVLFSKLVLIFSLVNVFEQPITVIIQATGSVKRYELFVGSITLMLLPLSYLAFYLGAPSYFSMILLIVLYFIAQFVRVFVAKYQVKLSFISYFRLAVAPVIFSITLIFFTVGILQYFIVDKVNLFFMMAYYFMLSFSIVFFFGINSEERLLIIEFAKKQLSKFSK